MSSDASKAKRGQIERLVTSLAQDVQAHTGGRGLQPKLIPTAVNVLSKAVTTSQDKCERVGCYSQCLFSTLHPAWYTLPLLTQEVQAAKKAFAQTANAAQFEHHLQHLYTKGYVHRVILYLKSTTAEQPLLHAGHHSWRSS